MHRSTQGGRSVPELPGYEFIRHVAGWVGGAVLLFLLIWFAWKVLLLAFAGVLLGLVLSGLTGFASRRIGLVWSAAYSLVLVVIVAVISLAVAIMAPHISAQVNQLTVELPRAIGRLRQMLEGSPVTRHIVEAAPSFFSTGDPIGRMVALVSHGIEAAASAIVVLVVGLYVSLEPETYFRGLTALIPQDRRRKAEQVLAEVSDTLRWWIMGQMIPMVVLGTATVIGLWLLGIRLALLLGLLTAILIFIRYAGSLLSSIPALLIALINGPAMVLWVALLYTAIHVAEGYFLTPIVQRRAVLLPPALTVVTQLLFWQLAGLLGVALATPLAAAGLVAVTMLYLKLPPHRRATARVLPKQI